MSAPDIVDGIMRIVDKLPLAALMALAERLAALIQSRTPESEIRAGEAAADAAAEELEKLKFPNA